MIPNFTSAGFLPPGRHRADWNEFLIRFGHADRRRKLLTGLQQILNLLALAGCREVRVGGSLVTGKPVPNDFDGVWMMEGVDQSKLPLEINASIAAQFDIFEGTLVPEDHHYTDIGSFVDVIEKNKQNQSVGVVVLDPRQVPMAEPFPRYRRFFEEGVGLDSLRSLNARHLSP